MTNIQILCEMVQEIKDFRSKRGQRFKLHNLLTISILSIIAGADDYEAMAEFAKSRQSFLKENQLIEKNRLPSHDLFRWIFIMLDKDAFSKFLSILLEKLIEIVPLDDSTLEEVPKKMIHIDGKSLRATRTSEHSRTALQIVSAYCSNTHLSIGQLIIDGKSCEKTAIPQLIDFLDLKDSVVTIDAIATSKKNAQKIVDKQGDYLLALKKNNRLFYEEVDSFFQNFKGTALISDTVQTIDKAHGRLETRTCHIISDLQYFPDAEGWAGLKSLIYVEAQRTIKGVVSLENRYYLSSLKANASQLLTNIRKHWTVENNLHWSLDVAFNEDKSRVKDQNAAFNLAALRRFSLAVLKNTKVSKHSIKTQRLQAAWNDQFLQELFSLLEKTY